MNRRAILTGLVGLVAAPAVLRLGAHMPVKAVRVEPEDWIQFRRPDGTWGEKQAIERRGRHGLVSPPTGWERGEICYRFGADRYVKGPVMVHKSRRHSWA